MKNLLQKMILASAAFFFMFNIQTVKAQDFGADVVSSYVWRGTQFGTGPHIQPWMELGSGAITGGIWGSFPTTGGDGGHELDLWLSADLGPLALTVTNYSFPGVDGTYTTGGVFDGDLEVSGSTSLFDTVDLTVGYFTDLEALYIEAGFPLGPVGVAVGYGSDGDGAFYAGGDSGLVNLSFSGSKDIKITEDYSLPVFGSFIYNPDAESAFLVFGFSF
ncbi:MAG: hypothetical protein ISQ41_01360 [Flavobacteriaceae bacterium]|nr:hypothetical protein [Flavobacteriaceae bacterium]MBL6684102.1 hypothetical protein [Flavobacteriaceae bacterium]